MWKIALMTICVGLFVFPDGARAQSRVKDVASIQGARDNQLVGYGIVVGLNGEGDSDSILIHQTVANMVKRFGVTVNANSLKAKNAATVMVTAKIPSNSRNGDKIDVSVSSMADAKSLQGGTLLQTPLVAPDGTVYAVAQGSVFVGGIYAGVGGPGGATVTKNIPTAGAIPGGALVEREIPTNLFPNGVLEVVLREHDFTSAVRMANAINEQIGPMAQAVSNSTVQIFVPREAQVESRRMEFIARVENVVFRPDAAARIVINERTGTIVANSRIRIDRVAVSHGNLTVSIVRSQNVSQPNSFTGNETVNVIPGGATAAASASTSATGAASAGTAVTANGNTVYENEAGGQIQVPPGTEPPAGYRPKMNPAGGGQNGGGVRTVVTDSTTTKVEEEKKNFVVLDDLPTVDEVATALNTLGVTPRDMMSIFQTMKQAGALQAELVLQ
jgi:flagellar P-ring protein FlgI